MSNYYVVVHKDDDSDFGAFFPDLPGCFSAGATEDEALENARISLRMYVEDLAEDGHDLPAARALANLRDDEDVKAYGMVVVNMIAMQRRVRGRVHE